MFEDDPVFALIRQIQDDEEATKLDLLNSLGYSDLTDEEIEELIALGLFGKEEIEG